MKKLIVKSVIVIGAWVALKFGYDILRPMAIADASVMQLQDSDATYAHFKGVQRAFDFYWVLYVLPLLVFIKDIKKLSK